VIKKSRMKKILTLIVVIGLTLSLFGLNSYAEADKSVLFIEDGSYSGYTINNGLSDLRMELVNIGFQVDQITVSSISADDLVGYDVVVFSTGWSWYGSGPGALVSSSTVDIFKDFVNGGGGLYLLGENSGFPVWNNSVSNIGEPFGLQVDMAEYVETVDDITSHEVTEGVDSISFPYGSAISVDSPAMSLARFSNGKTMLAVSEYGAGRVAIIADINVHSNSYINTEDNLQLELNIFNWLAEGSGNTPKDDSMPKPIRGNHELVTLLTNPMDNSGVRTMDLNYYMNDPIIWGTDVKNITVWLETEIFDLAAAKQKAKLPAGLMLLKDYNIRLMMKIVYNDGTIETKEVDNAYIARNIPVLIPVDEFAGTSDLGIVYMDTEGNTAVLPVNPVTIDGMNYLKFENNHFSEYGVVSGTAQTPAEQQQYIIQPGDTLASIAAKFGVTVQSLAAANNISNIDMIYAGKILIIA